jgi:hypothetical protein
MTVEQRKATSCQPSDLTTPAVQVAGYTVKDGGG